MKPVVVTYRAEGTKGTERVDGAEGTGRDTPPLEGWKQAGPRKHVRSRAQQDSEDKYRRRIARLSGKRRSGREPLDLELIVLFLSVSIIILIPWLLHDARLILLVPMTFLVVPGLFGVLLKATGEFVTILATSRRKEKERRREEKARGLQARRRGRGWQRRQSRPLHVRAGSMIAAVIGFMRGVARFWEGFI